MFRGILLSKQFSYYYGNVYEFLEELIHAFAAKLGNKCWFSSAMLVLIRTGTNMASPNKPL